ncbi:MAG: 3'-5' exonuclease [Cetobacterium sp.]
MEKKVMFFDTETNGFAGSSVLSFSAYVVNYTESDTGIKYKVIDKIDRYYYPVESFNPNATNINGLRKSVLDKKRVEVEYSEYFKDDDFIYELCESMDLFVAHNIKFDEGFLPFKLEKSMKYCTMDESAELCKLPYKNPIGAKRYNTGRYKNPKLMELSNFFNLELDENLLHTSIYDVDVMFRCFMSLAVNPMTSKRVKDFLFPIDNNSSILEEEDLLL